LELLPEQEVAGLLGLMVLQEFPVFPNDQSVKQQQFKPKGYGK
jgi:hypothetical protein